MKANIGFRSMVSYKVQRITVFSCLFFCVTICNIWSQTNRLTTSSPIFPTAISSEMVGSVQVLVHPSPEEYRPYPVIHLNTDETIQITFDLLDDIPQIIEYTITHCNAHWEASFLNYGEYMQGMEIGQIETSEASWGTMVSYRNYQLTIGKEGTQQPTISGNYLLKAWIAGKRHTPLFQAAFAVVEELVQVNQEVTPVTMASLYDRHQTVNIEVLPSLDEQTHLHSYYQTVVGQNGSQGRNVWLLQPNEIATDRWSYRDSHGALFWGGNTFRATEILTDKHNGMGVNHSFFDNGVYCMELFTDQGRGQKNYISNRSAQGRYVMRNVEQPQEARRTTDYYAVRFSLRLGGSVANDLQDGAVLIEGQALDPLPSSYKKLRYNPETGLYEREILLKGGYIGYRYYPCLSRDSNELSCTVALNEPNVIEGDYYQTENSYTALVYRRLPTDRYDQLVGISVIYSALH